MQVDKRSLEFAVLRESALKLECARVAEGKTYEVMTGDARATIIKCIFKIRGVSGFSKITSKKDTTEYLAAIDDVGALLRSDVESSSEPTAAEVEPPRAVLGDLSAEEQAELEKSHLEIHKLLVKCKLIRHGRGAAPPVAPSAPTDAPSAPTEI